MVNATEYLQIAEMNNYVERKAKKKGGGKKERSVFEQDGLVLAIGCAWMVNELRHETLIWIPTSRVMGGVSFGEDRM